MDIIICGYIDRGNLSLILVAYMDLFCWTVRFSSRREGVGLNRYLASWDYHIIIMKIWCNIHEIIYQIAEWMDIVSGING